MIARRSFSQLILLGCILFAYIAVQIYCINQLSPNYDEGSFASYGTTLLKFQREKDVVLYESKLPITALNMIPRAVEQIIRPGLTKSWPESQSDIIHGRYVSLLFAVLLALLIFSWSKKIYDEKTALVILLMYLLCPNFLAHGIFVSSDIFACFFMTAALYCLWLFFREYKFKYFLLMCVVTGFAEVSKFSMFHLFLIIPFLFVTQIIYQQRTCQVTSFTIKRIISYFLVFVAINWLIICAAHIFYQVFTPIGTYQFRSNSFKVLQSFLMRISQGLPVPLPSSYLKSMDAVMYFDHLGGGVIGSLNGAPYILGQSSIKGFWYYYLVAILYKVPIALLTLWVTSILSLCFRFSRKVFFQNDIFLLVPIFYFLIYMSFFYSTQVGIRHLLIIFPLLFILSGNVISQFILQKKRWLIYFFLGYQAISVFSYFPDFLPYTNEFIVNKKLAYKKIADTNICYGEGQNFLQDYLASHPHSVYMPERPTPGEVILEVNEMLNLNIATVHKYDWANSLTPINHIHSQYLVFNVTKAFVDSVENLHRKL